MLEPLIKLKHENTEKHSQLIKLDEKLAELEHLRLQLIKNSEPPPSTESINKDQTDKSLNHSPFRTNKSTDIISSTGTDTVPSYESKTVKEIETVVLSMTNLDAQKSMSRRSIPPECDSLTSSPNKKALKKDKGFSPRGSTFIGGSKHNIGPNSTSKYTDLWPLRVIF